MNTTYLLSSFLHRVAAKTFIVATLCATTLSSHAQMLFNSAPGSANVLSDTVGYAFTVKETPLSAYRLGVYDTLGDGLTTMNIIGLWLEGGTLLATAILPSGKSAPLESGFRWFDLTTPVTLNANTTYRIGVQANLEMHPSGFVTDPISPHINLVGAVRNNQQQNFTYPGTAPFSGQAIVGPNLAYNVVPEPSIAHLVASTAIALFAFRFFKRIMPRQRRVPVKWKGRRL